MLHNKPPQLAAAFMLVLSLTTASPAQENSAVAVPKWIAAIKEEAPLRLIVAQGISNRPLFVSDATADGEPAAEAALNEFIPQAKVTRVAASIGRVGYLQREDGSEMYYQIAQQENALRLEILVTDGAGRYVDTVITIVPGRWYPVASALNTRADGEVRSWNVAVRIEQGSKVASPP